MDIDRLAELVQAGFSRLEGRIDAVERHLKDHDEEFRSLRVEMRESFQTVHDRFVSTDLRFDHVANRLDHVAARQDILEITLRPLPEKVSALEASLTGAFHSMIKEVEPVHLQLFGVNQRLDNLSDEMRQRFRALKAG